MDHGSTRIPINEAGVKTSEPGVGAKVDRFIAVIESRPFVREVICHALQSAFSLPVVGYSTASEVEGHFGDSAAVAILSLTGASVEACIGALKILTELGPSAPIVVLAPEDDVDLARAAVHSGAKGYIPCTMGFEIAVEAVRFVLTGGTYAPMDCLLATGQPGLPKSPDSSRSGTVTPREFAVIGALRQGKPNKVIAHELKIAESTVKVHVYNVMRKLRARNRTEVAVRAQTATLALEVDGTGRCSPLP
jgi:DNA-binding NarL/FixJ family response regulator